MTSLFCTSQVLTFDFKTGSRPGEPLPLPWITRTQRSPCRTASRRKAARLSRASSRLRPCRSSCAWIDHTPRRSLRTTSGPIPSPRQDRASSVSSRDSTSNSSEIANSPTSLPTHRTVNSPSAVSSSKLTAASRYSSSNALARQRFGAWPLERNHDSATQRLNRPDGEREQIALALHPCCLGAGFRNTACRLGHGLLQCSQVLQAAQLAGRPHNSPRSANDTTAARPTIR